MLVAKANALWHTDSSFKKTPALASVLTARVLPGEDGDTEFTSTRLAWDRLPADLQGKLKNALPRTPTPTAATRSIPTSPMPRSARAAAGALALNWRNLANDRRALDVQATPTPSTAWTTATSASCWPSFSTRRPGASSSTPTMAPG